MSQQLGNGFTLVTSQFGERYIPTLNRGLFETAPSSELFNDSHAELLSKTDFLNLVIGTDSGLLLDHILKADLPAGSQFIFIEHEQVIAALELAIPEPLQDKVKLITVVELSDLLCSGQFDVFMLKQQTLITLSYAAKEAYFDEYCLLKLEILKQKEAAIFHLTANLNQQKFIEQQLINVADNRFPAKLLAGAIKGRDCLIVGGGPSLDTHMDWLRENQDKFYIFTVSRVAKKLYDQGVHPDIVVSVDPYNISFTVSKDMLYLPDNVIFVNGYHAVNTLVSQWTGAQFYLGEQFPWHKEDNFAAHGPTVSNASLALAADLGFEQIMLLGVDLCNSQTGLTHAQGTREAKLGPKINLIGEWVETYAGEMAETPIQLACAMETLKSQVAFFAKTKFINLSINAAKIDGVTCIEPADFVLDDFLDKSKARAQIKEKYAIAPTQDWLQGVKTELQTMANHCRQVELKSSKAIKLLKHFPVSQLKIDRIEADLRQKYESALRLIQSLGIREISQFLSSRNAEELTEDELKELQRLYYQAMVNTAPYLLQLINSGLEVLESRIWETNPKAVITKLQQAWMKQRCPRRGMMVQKRFNLDAERKEFIELQQAFAEQMQDNVSNKNSELETMTHWPLTNVPDKIHQLFMTGNQLGLKQVIYGLDNFQINDEAKSLSARAKSYLAELTEDYPAALQSLLELPIELRQDADKRQLVKLAISTQQYDVAIEIMYELIKVTDIYMPLLAKTLKFKRDYLAAVEVWLLYLDKNDQDIDSWCALGNLLLDADSPQDALQIFSQVLEMVPNHPHATAAIQNIVG